MSECDALLERRDHAAYGTPVKGRERFEWLVVLDVEYGHWWRLATPHSCLMCGSPLPLLDKGPPLHGPVGGEDARVGQCRVEEGPQHAVWLSLQHSGEHGRPVVRDAVQDDLKKCTKVGTVFRATLKAVEPCSGGIPTATRVSIRCVLAPPFDTPTEDGGTALWHAFGSAIAEALD